MKLLIHAASVLNKLGRPEACLQHLDTAAALAHQTPVTQLDDDTAVAVAELPAWRSKLAAVVAMVRPPHTHQPLSPTQPPLTCLHVDTLVQKETFSHMLLI